MTNSDFSIFEIISIMVTSFFKFEITSWPNKKNKTKNLLYSYEVPKNQQEVPKIRIVDKTFFTFIVILTLNI